MRDLVVQAGYLTACVFFIFGLKSLTRPDQAMRGMRQAAIGMLVAIVGTMIHRDIISWPGILVGLTVGSVLGYPLGQYVPMTAMPQRIAFSHMFGALAATLVGVAKYYHAYHGGAPGEVGFEGLNHAVMAAVGFEVLFGSLTVTGSFMAFGKLQEFLPGRPITYRGQNVVNIATFFVALGCFFYLIFNPADARVFYVMTALGFLIGVSMVLPIGGADMPVVISLLNSYAGLAASATGFAIDNTVLIICGALDGASGFILSILMCKAMNRSFGNILFGAFGTVQASAAKAATGLSVKSISPEDLAMQLGYGQRVFVVPGYGLAVSQAQHQIRELADLIEKRGGTVKYAIHPVAGRMPGHMNVLLAEANVPYEQLHDMDDINGEFKDADVTLVIGANDVVNPAARNDTGSPIYGMPILNADQSKTVIVFKRSMNPGFAGIENELFYAPNTFMLFGDAKASLTKLIGEVKTL